MTSIIDSSNSSGLRRTTLARQIQSLVAKLQPVVAVERRHNVRVAIALLFDLTPLDSNGRPREDRTITVVGKDISSSGLSFYHDQPLAYRRAIVSLDHPGYGRFMAEVDVRWCRFAKPGWYESGGRLIRALSPEPQSPHFLSQ